MPVALYMDVHIPRAITLGLRLRHVDVLTAQEDGTTTLSDPALLDRATALRRMLFTFDDDLLAEGTRRQRAAEPFSGVIYARFQEVPIGRCIEDLEMIAKAGEAEEFINRVLFLPL